ncbi:MAG: hypothetical protein HOY79_17750 [Streptomyces sp.]|nr:hypothetical protein [Streptomyces sp.]
MPAGARKLSASTPPLPGPPEDAVALYVAWQAARERLEELRRTLPPAGESAAGGVVMPLRDEQVVEAEQAVVAAATAFYRHPWWYGAFSKSQAERVIEGAARRAVGQ